MNSPVTVRFLFMDGLGNDFVIVDAREQKGFALTTEQVRALAARSNQQTGGCDQVIVMEDGAPGSCFMRIYNQDGSEVSSCGNATRCVGELLLKEGGDTAHITTSAGHLKAFRSPQGISVDMGAPRLDWQEIPLGWELDTLKLWLYTGPLVRGVAVSMGNPHVVFFVEDDVDGLDLDRLAPQVQHWELEGRRLFPEGVNVGVANIVSDTELKLRVFERGVGETLACGTGACAAAVAAARRGHTKRTVTLHLRGGDLHVHWQENNHVLMTGPVRLRAEKTASLKEMLA